MSLLRFSEGRFAERHLGDHPNQGYMEEKARQAKRQNNTVDEYMKQKILEDKNIHDPNQEMKISIKSKEWNKYINHSEDNKITCSSKDKGKNEIFTSIPMTKDGSYLCVDPKDGKITTKDEPQKFDVIRHVDIDSKTVEFSFKSCITNNYLLAKWMKNKLMADKSKCDKREIFIVEIEKKDNNDEDDQKQK